MSYVIVINLDYGSYPQGVCVELWQAIRDKMHEAGFRLDGRRFRINLPQQEACDLARQTLENLEPHLEYHQRHIFSYLRDFYGYEQASATNLLLPAVAGIELN